ncbi:hypothetical protein [Mesorhizobium sp. M0522]|uniref:hypothetical protein n=1 Tax=Mesorhizobium sp. M0522 TaxID=2956958 RepID=UPI00333B5718
MRHHQESTELQYSLVDRAVRLGWPPDRIVVIDEDLGKSGTGQVERGGFQRLIAEIGLGNAGLVVSLISIGAQQPGLASTPRVVLIVRRCHRRW